MPEAHQTGTAPARAFVIHPDLGDRRDQRRSPDLALEEAVELLVNLARPVIDRLEE